MSGLTRPLAAPKLRGDVFPKCLLLLSTYEGAASSTEVA
jgi:hypothetical protein